MVAATVIYAAPMARSGPQALPDVSLHDAYRFESRGGDRIGGFVFKQLPRRVTWEARIDGTSIAASAETRREAIERAIAELRRQRTLSGQPSPDARCSTRANA